MHHNKLTIAGLDPAIFFAATKKDARVKPGHGEWWKVKRVLTYAPAICSAFSTSTCAWRIEA
jgi:hypothetical protein